MKGKTVVKSQRQVGGPSATVSLRVVLFVMGGGRLSESFVKGLKIFEKVILPSLWRKYSLKGMGA